MADPYAAFSSPTDATPAAAGPDPYAAFSSAAPAATAHVGRMARNPAIPSNTRQPPETWSDFGAGVRDAVEQGGTGINEGLATSVARPLDAIPYLASKAFGGEGVHPVENAFRGAFVDNHPQATTDAQRIMRTGGNLVGENLPFSAAGVTAAAKIPALAFESAAPVAGNIWQTAKGGFRNYGDAMARQPGKAFIGDSTGAGEAGAGGEAYRQKAEDTGGNQQAAEMAGQFAVPAGLAAYTKWGPGGMFRMAASSATDALLKHTPEAVLPASLRPAGGGPEARKAEQLAFSNNEGKYAPNEGINGVPPKELPVAPPPEPSWMAKKMDAGAQARADEATNVVARDFGKVLAKPDAQANLAETNRLKAEIPGFEPGIAKATNDPALLNKQANYDSTAVNEDLRQRQAATDTSHGAIRKYMDETVPAAGENPQDRVAEASKGRVQAEQTNLGAQADEVQGKIKGVSDSLPEVDPTVTGNLMRETRAGLKTEADKQMYHLRGQVDPSGTGVVSLPPRTPDGEPVNMSVNAALNRRAQINQDLADHYGASNRDQAAVRSIRQLQEEKATLDDAIEHASSSGAEGLKAYNDYYKNEYAPKFLQGASKQVGQFSRNGYEGNKVAAEDVPTKMLGPNSISEARQVNKLYGDNPEVKQQIIDHHLDDLRRTAIDPNTGQIKEGAVDKYLAKNERLFNEMPWVRDAIASKNPDALYKQLGDLEQRQRAAADSKLGQLAKNGNPEAHIAAGINDWQVMRDLHRSMGGDPQAEAALRRAVWDHVLGAAGGEGPINADAVQKLLLPEAQGGHRRALAQVLTPQHLNNLDNVIKATRIENRLDRPTGTYEKPSNFFSKFEDATGTSIPTLGATTSALARGRSSPVYEVARLMGNMWKGISDKSIRAIEKEALSNPDVAKQLAVIGKGGVPTQTQLGRMKNYTLALGIHDAEEDHTK